MPLSDQQMHARMVAGWRGGLPETKCGIGSTMESTRRAREWLPDIVQRYAIESVCDAGAGDLHWIPPLPNYRAFDLIPRHESVTRIDITRVMLPVCDAILCRHVLNHIPGRVQDALFLFRCSAPYLIATQFDTYDGSKEFTRLDLRKFLGEPIESVEDGGAAGCRLAIWRFSQSPG